MVRHRAMGANWKGYRELERQGGGGAATNIEAIITTYKTMVSREQAEDLVTCLLEAKWGEDFGPELASIREWPTGRAHDIKRRFQGGGRSHLPLEHYSVCVRLDKTPIPK